MRKRDAAFLSLVLVMAAHEAEHVAQLLQKDGLGNACAAGDCRGALGFLFDLEWVHFLYNTSIFAALLAFAAIYRTASWLWVAVGLQSYHVVEHVVKIDQWLANGHHPPTPGILGHAFPLVELHFAINTLVFAAVAAGVAGLGLHRARFPVALAGALLVLPVGIAWATRTPTAILEAGVHQGPLVLDRTQKLVGEPGAIVRGGIVVRADGVVVRNVEVVGGETGILVQQAKGVVLDRVTVRGATLDGIAARRSSVTIRDCTVVARSGTQAIDISFGMMAGKSVVERCAVSGGAEGIAAHMVAISIRRNRVSDTSLRAITITEMSHGDARDNEISGAVGVGIFCGDYSSCEIEGNRVDGTAPDPAGSRTQIGYAIQAHYGASALLRDNRLSGNARAVGAFLNAEIRRG